MGAKKALVKVDAGRHISSVRVLPSKHYPTAQQQQQQQQYGSVPPALPPSPALPLPLLTAPSDALPAAPVWGSVGGGGSGVASGVASGVGSGVGSGISSGVGSVGSLCSVDSSGLGSAPTTISTAAYLKQLRAQEMPALQAHTDSRGSSRRGSRDSRGSIHLLPGYEREQEQEEEREREQEQESESAKVSLLLSALSPTAPADVREAGLLQLKRLVKGGEGAFWARQSKQIINALLEPLHLHLHPHLHLHEGAVGRSARSGGSGTNSRSGSVSSTGSASARDAPVSDAQLDAMYASMKALLHLSRHRAPLLVPLLPTLLPCLTAAAPRVPPPLAQSFEALLGACARCEPKHTLRALLPYAGEADGEPKAHPHSHSQSQTLAQTLAVQSPSTQLLAIHVLCICVPLLSPAQLLHELPLLAPRILPALGSARTDLRRAVVLLLVELYVIAGDALFPHIRSLTPPQRKLLTIYIEKRVEVPAGVENPALYA